MIFKYLKLLGQWKDVREIYKEEHNGQEKPWYISRRLLGLVVAFIGAVIYTVFDFVITPEMLGSLTDNIAILQDVITKAVPAVTSIYGAITAIIGIIKKSAPTKE